LGFYEELSKYYDIVFPLGQAQLNFISSRAMRKKKILDLAAGTGNYSIALSKMGYEVTAVDLDEEMVRKVEEKNKAEGTNTKALILDMKEVENLSDKFDLIICIGNSLVHLQNKEEIQTLIKKLYKLLEKDGVLIIQIVNYDRILDNNVKELPLISREDKGVKFIRNYEKENEKILFKSKLVISEDSEEKVYDNVVELYPLRSGDLELILKEAGFKKVDLYGDFNEGQYNLSSMATVVAARK
jgi:SAM-dependent methyltransferase